MPTAGLIGGALGGIGGLVSGLSSDLLDAPNAREQRGFQVEQGALNQLDAFTAAGPGQRDVQGALVAQRDLAQQFRASSLAGGLPTGADIAATRGIAQTLFQPQQVSLEQEFGRQRTSAAQLSARLGRSVNDPVLLAKLGRSQAEQQERLQARIGATGQELALAVPGQRLFLAQESANIQSRLASQAFTNRQTLLGLGSNIGQAAQQFRINRFQVEQRGSLGAGLSGLIGGAGQGAQAGIGLSNLFGGGGGQPQNFGQQGGFGGFAQGANSAFGRGIRNLN